MQRMKWIRDDRLLLQRSACGRFEVGGSIWTGGGSVYVRLFDILTGKEYPCRTEASAKAAARNLSRAATPQPERQVVQVGELDAVTHPWLIPPPDSPLTPEEYERAKQPARSEDIPF